MKKIIFHVLSITVLLVGTINVNAQIGFEGSNEYGRIYDITYDINIENTIYAITLSNHLIESVDNGINWEVLYSFPEDGPSLTDLKLMNGTILSFTIINSGIQSNNTIYLFDLITNEISGQYITPTPTDSTKRWVESYSIYEGDTDIVLLHLGYKIGSAAFAKVYYTADGGANWIEVYEPTDNDGIFPNNVAISPNNSDKLFIARGVGPNGVEGGLFISEDAGSTWTEKIVGQSLKSIAFNPQNPETILVGTGNGFITTVENLYRSIDGGDTWQIVPITWDNFFLDSINYIAYNPNDVNSIIVLEGNEIALSSDGGASWSNYIYGDEPGSYFYGLHASFNPFQSNEVTIATDYYPVRSVDGGVTVSQFGNPFFYSRQVGVSTEGDQHLYYSVQGGIVHKNLTTLIETPHYVNPINIVSSNAEPNFKFDKNIEGRVYMFTSSFPNQFLWVSNDHGENINNINSTEFDYLIDITGDPNNDNIIWVSYDIAGTLIIDFTNINSPIRTTIAMPNNELHFSTFIDPLNSDHVLVGQGGTMHESLDSGLTWTNVSSGITLDPQTDRIYDIQQNPNNNDEYVIATSQGIFKSIDGAQNWNQVYVGLNVNTLEYSPIADGVLVASIKSSENTQAQVLFSVNNGDSWEEVPFEDIAYVGSNGMDFIFHDENITAYLSTYDLGVISVVIDTNVSSTPPNNDCVDAIAVICGETYVGETNTATDSGSNEAPDVWYSYTGTGTVDTVTLSFCNGNTDYDSLVRVFDACDGTEIAINDDFCGLQSEVEFVSDGTTTYYIMVEGFGSNSGNYSMAVVCLITGIEDNALDSFSFYPNPANNNINLSAQGNIETVVVYNILGQKVVSQNIDASNSNINVSNLSAGTYIMKVSIEGQVGTYKIVKK